MIEVLGLSEVTAGLEARREQLEAATKRGLELAGERVRDAWKHNIEAEGLILTGRYHDSVHVVVEEQGVVVLSDVPYSPILEHGDSRQVAHYPATRAADESHAQVLDAVEEPMRRVL